MQSVLRGMVALLPAEWPHLGDLMSDDSVSAEVESGKGKEC